MGRILLFLLAFLLIAGAFLGDMYFSRYNVTLIPYPFLLRIVCWVAGLAGVGIILALTTFRRKKVDKYISAWKENLRLNGEKIIVDLERCEVKANFYYEEVAKVHSTEAQAYNALIGQSYRNVEQQSRNSAVIVFRYTLPRTGKEQVFVSPLLRKDKVSLGFLLAEKKETNIYVNRADAGDYFFDVDFLFEHD
jgi:hypothetical protein